MPEIPKAYEPQAVEAKWYQFWLEQKCFVADASSSKPAYSIVIPPPNVTGILTLGHVLNNTIQDILARLARMRGFEVLWLPGTDHAGIGTQTVVEKSLRQQGLMKHREDIGREKFLEKTWEWKEKHGGIIIDQLKKLGASCDWSRERFTMDPEYARCVQLVFVELHRKGLIYRGKRMVNWDPAARTALSDEEVEMTEQRGHLWHLKYPLADESGRPRADEFIVVATSRPETMLGDEAVAVNPADPRYQHLVGRRAWLPLREKTIPIVADELVDPKFGTGCVKVTPAHDPNDYQMGLRHSLPLTVVIGPNGAMTAEAGPDFAGKDRMVARKLVVEKLSDAGFLLKTEDHIHNVGFSQRSNVPIEPYLSEQWFLRYPCVTESTKAVEQQQIKFQPERWSKTYLHWMENIRDWCISRQLWWGHRIPVWYRKSPAAGGAAPNIWVDINPPPDPENWEQDTDVLDTWFSSWLWPFATMGWPERTPTLQKFYPTTDLVTGPDIIFFWVARMIMAGYEFMGDKPFANVYFTGIVRDKQGRKMSKSLGNSPDPLKLINEYGADALRFGIMRSAPLGQDVLYDEQQVELGRNFCNKLWNACRFRQMQAGAIEGEISPPLLTSDDRWIMLKLDQAIRELTAALGAYKFNEAAQILHRFFWSELCDWYLEASKAAMGPPSAEQSAPPSAQAAALRANTLAVMDFVLSNTLRLFHPFLPFITEELWHGLGYHQDLPPDQGGNTIMFAHWPKPLDDDFREYYRLDDRALQHVEQRNWLVTQGRNLRQSANIPAGKKANFVLKTPREIAPHDLAAMRLLLNAAALEVNTNYAPPKGTPSVAGDFGELHLPLEGLIDVAAERSRLAKELEKVRLEIEKVERKLANPAFTGKAPAAVLDEHKQRLADWQAKHAQLKNSLEALGGTSA